LINEKTDEYNISSIFKDYDNIFIENSLINGSADQQTFKIFLEKDDADIAIFIQDSMLLNIPLTNIETGVKFMWHFTNHIKDWDIINEPPNNNNIITHTDLIRFQLIEHYSDYTNFLNFALKSLDNKEKWCGCFGNCCIIDRKTLLYMNEQINFIQPFILATSNRQRRANESIFSLICHYLFPEQNFYNSFDGLYYDGYNVNPYHNTSTSFDDLVWCCRNKYISKISFSR
jgi:hypothetical protein